MIIRLSAALLTAFVWAFLGSLVAGIAQADWASTRETSYDWACMDGTTVVSSHQRQDTAFVACSNLTIKDGKARQVKGGSYRITATVPVSTPTPTPTAGSTPLSWTPPTQNTNGSALTNLAGYRIVYGTSATALTQVVQLANPALTAYIVEGLAPGTHYFAVKAYTTAGAESGLSNIAQKTVQ